MDKQSIRNDSLSIGAGIVTYYLTKNLCFQTRKAIFSRLHPRITEDRIEPLRKSIDELIKNEHFDYQKISIIDASTPEYAKIRQKGLRAYLFSLKRKIVSTKNPIKKIKLANRHKREISENKKWLELLAQGANGRYIDTPGNKQIEVNMKKGIHIFFHEAGHAIDFSKPYLKNMFKNNKNKHLIKIPIFATLITALTTPKNKENKNFLDKMDSFVKKHCAFIAPLGLLPMMVCESSANFRGQLLAKKYAQADLKLLTKSHLYSMASYWTLPLVAGLSVWAACKVKDKVAEKLKSSDPKTLKS